MCALGRVLDLANKGVMDLSKATTCVLDEADKLLSPEFIPVMEQIIGHCHKSRQILLFSATFPGIDTYYPVFSLFTHTRRRNCSQIRLLSLLFNSYCESF